MLNKIQEISFFDNGDMLITNEGQQNKPTVLRFNYYLPGTSSAALIWRMALS